MSIVNPSATVTSEIKSQTIQAFMAEKDYVQVAKAVRTNAKGYPFVTFINSKNEAENIYFTKKLGHIAAGTAVDKALFSELQIVHVNNAAGEARTKLSGMGESGRVEASDLF